MDNFIMCKTQTSNPRVALEACYVNSQIKNTEQCAGCSDWMDAAPAEAFQPCPHCEEPLLIITIKKCPICGGKFLV